MTTEWLAATTFRAPVPGLGRLTLRGGRLSIVHGRLWWRPLWRFGRGWDVALADVAAVNPDGAPNGIVVIVEASGRRHRLLLSDRMTQPVWARRAGWAQGVADLQAAVAEAKARRGRGCTP